MFILFFGCTKPLRVNDASVNLAIIKIETQKTQNLGENILSQVTCSGPDLCYHFSNFNVTETGTNEYEIRAIGTYPNHSAECLQAIYYKDTTAIINANIKGEYLLHFFNNNILYKTDTVEVN